MDTPDGGLALSHPLIRIAEEGIREIWRGLGADVKREITPEMIWCYIVYTDFGRRRFQSENIDGHLRLLTRKIRDQRLNPFAARILDLQPSTSRILVVVKRQQGRDIEGLVRERVLEYTQQAIGLSSLEIQYCFAADTFWLNFFGARRYLSGEAKDVPAAIVTTGEIRAYAENFPINVPVAQFLLRVGMDWNVPVGLMNLDKSGALTPKELPR